MTDTRPHFWFDSNTHGFYGENLDPTKIYWEIYENNMLNFLNEEYTEDQYFYDNINQGDEFTIIEISSNLDRDIIDLIDGGFNASDIISELGLSDCLMGTTTAFNELYLGEEPTPTDSWTINNKTVKNLQIGNKTIQTIERVSDGAIIYQRPPVYELTLTSDKATASTGENVTFTVTLTLDGVAVSDEIVTFTDGTNTLGRRITNSNGVVALTYSWNNAGTFNVKAIFGTTQSNISNVTITQPKINTEIRLIGSNLYLRSVKGVFLANKTVHIYSLVGDYDVITNNDGKINVDIDDVLIAEFYGDDNYNGCSYG